MAQTVRGNKGAFISLATDACDLVYVVISTQRGMDDKGTTANSKLSDNLQGLTKFVARLNIPISPNLIAILPSPPS